MSGLTSSLGPKENLIGRTITLTLLLLFFLQLTRGSMALSLTSDEPPHIAHGYLLLVTGDTWALPEHRHPPLLNVLTAWPLLLQPERPDPTMLPGWHEDFVVFVRHLWPALGPVERQAFVTRFPNMLLGTLLMALLAHWARSAFGRRGAWLAVAVMALDPAMVAHSQLNTTDIGIALFAFAAVYLASRERSGRAALLGTGLTLGAAVAAKGSGVILIPIVLGLLAWQRLSRWAQGEIGVGEACRQATLAGFVVLIVAFAAVWATYGFRLEPSTLQGLRLPLVEHSRMVRLILGEKARTAFLMGEVRQGGWWWYFPFAFLVKTPLPLILLLVGAAAHLASRPRRLLARPELWGYPLLHLGTSMLSGMNIGYRHLLPMLPFGYLAIAALAQRRIRPARSRQVRRIRTVAPTALLLLLVSWLAVEATTVYPFGLAYFNQLAGGSSRGYRYLVDSNVDWGQSFKALAVTMQERQIDHVYLSYYTWIDPAVYGVNYTPLPPAAEQTATLGRSFDPQPGLYAISATPLQGVMVTPPDLYAWFRERQPIAQPGYGLLLYEVQPRDTTPIWLAQCSQPVEPLSDEAVVTGFGREELRRIGFDCIQGWIIPNGGRDAGWYALHADIAFDPFVERRLGATGAFLSYRQPRAGALPPFSIYEQRPIATGPETPIEPPIPFGVLSLVGYRLDSPVARPGTSLEIETWWQVQTIPDRPLSLMLHVGEPDAPPIAVGDGLAVPTDTWYPGDTVIQRHVLDIPSEVSSGSYSASTGVYWLDTLERWTALDGPHQGATTMALASIEIRER